MRQLYIGEQVGQKIYWKIAFNSHQRKYESNH